MMSQSDIYNMLGSLQIGTIIAWLIVLGTITAVIIKFGRKLYKIFEVYRNIKKENSELKEKVEKHDNELDSVNKKLDMILEKMNTQHENDIKKLRYSIVRAGEEYLEMKHMTIRQWRSLHEMYDVYHKDGNSYVTSLMNRIDNEVEIIGQLDENGCDL